MLPDIKRSSKKKAKGLMKNNPLKLDNYIQQFYAQPELMHIKKMEIKSVISTSPSFQPPLTNYQNYWTFASKIQEFDK